VDELGKPPYIITEKAADFLAKIVEIVTHLEFGTNFKRDFKLHRENRVRTIHSSLAIEGNTLSLSDVSAVIQGKWVAGKQTEIKEVRNAYEAYDRIMTFDPYNIADFLNAHRLMTDGLVSEAGMFRSGDVGVFNGDVAVHIGARPQFVPGLMEELFVWASESDLHPVLKSAILHYEIETIHPFSDGNGRMGRLWQTLVLARWKTIFAWIPMESVIYANRPEYYNALYQGQHTGDCGTFIEFSLFALLSALQKMVSDLLSAEPSEHQDKHQDKHQDELTDTQRMVLKTLQNKALSRKEIFAAIGMNGDSRCFRRHIEPLLKAGLIERTVPDKPSSRLQRYRLTELGATAAEE